MMARPSGIITLTSDFGTEDGYAGAMKGRILSVFPKARIEDLSHDITAGDIEGAAWCLFTATRYYPSGTVHVAVVDPGVGGGRRPVMIDAGSGQIYVGPDNGIFHLASAGSAVAAAWEIDAARVSEGAPVSNTFHGRDVFAPAAAMRASGVMPRKIGSSVPPKSLTKLDMDMIYDVDGDVIKGKVLHVDRFGNMITSIPGRYSVVVFRGLLGRRTVQKPVTCYNDMREGEIHFIEGSSGLLEISARGRSAAGITGVTKGTEVVAFIKTNH
jgi:S-adenosylmethionine hydrolase